jgi:hypothetical protein
MMKIIKNYGWQNMCLTNCIECRLVFILKNIAITAGAILHRLFN